MRRRREETGGRPLISVDFSETAADDRNGFGPLIAAISG